MSPAPDPIAAVSQRVDTFLRSQRDLTASMGPEAALVVEAGAASVAGGKRLRARFCLAGWHSVTGADPSPAAIAAAGALELFHAAALVHDDVIDNSDTRRGKPAAHRALEGHHRDAGWHGDAESFGRAGAVLLGDLLVAWSDDLFEEGLKTASAPVALRARAEYATMRREVTIGQFLDIAEESAFRTEPDDRHAARALRVASLKSARYSVQQPLLIGAALGGSDAAQHEALAAFGHPLGMAYQLRDDVLGVFGDEAVTGKPSGDDLREGKRTVLVAYTREALPLGARRVFDELIGDPGLDATQISSLQETIVQTGALERVEALIADYAHEADRALSGARLDNAAVGELRDLARASTTRTA
ncbi:polyprenyl synthetase family protein [Microbacterium sp. ASV49]|uniref:Polyprenyl synthetase family protein n=1 Tax=Microbacterium candidum TaxID=3041922 RepID=A0ABT7N413_9MICO|nr:polyprenyl synthetase family protein [Microbacterium sp. ASV49]MDL9981406.1 polyprenyl synthetase family protein [Microbacterium sp. ASV49]